MVKVAVRVPVAPAGGVKVTEIEHDAVEAAAGQTVGAKSPEFGPATDTVMLVRVVPELSVTVCADDVVSAFWEPKVSDGGVGFVFTMTPFPAKLTVCGDPGPEYATLSVAPRAPWFPGLNVSEITQVRPTG